MVVWIESFEFHSNRLLCCCSGCITSAETVMLEKQSLDEFLSNISKGKAVVVSLSTQSRASLAAHFGLSPVQVRGLLNSVLI